MSREAGKGSTPRPFSVDNKTYEDNWNRIFGKKELEEEKHTDTKNNTEERK